MVSQHRYPAPGGRKPRRVQQRGSAPESLDPRLGCPRRGRGARAPLRRQRLLARDRSHHRVREHARAPAAHGAGAVCDGKSARPAESRRARKLHVRRPGDVPAGAPPHRRRRGRAGRRRRVHIHADPRAVGAMAAIFRHPVPAVRDVRRRLLDRPTPAARPRGVGGRRGAPGTSQRLRRGVHHDAAAGLCPRSPALAAAGRALASRAAARRRRRGGRAPARAGGTPLRGRAPERRDSPDSARGARLRLVAAARRVRAVLDSLDRRRGTRAGARRRPRRPRRTVARDPITVTRRPGRGRLGDCGGGGLSRDGSVHLLRRHPRPHAVHAPPSLGARLQHLPRAHPLPDRVLGGALRARRICAGPRVRGPSGRDAMERRRRTRRARGRARRPDAERHDTGGLRAACRAGVPHARRAPARRAGRGAAGADRRGRRRGDARQRARHDCEHDPLAAPRERLHGVRAAGGAAAARNLAEATAERGAAGARGRDRRALARRASGQTPPRDRSIVAFGPDPRGARAGETRRVGRAVCDHASTAARLDVAGAGFGRSRRPYVPGNAEGRARAFMSPGPRA